MRIGLRSTAVAAGLRYQKPGLRATGKRSEDYRLPQKGPEREAYILQVGEDGFMPCLTALKTAPKTAQKL